MAKLTSGEDEFLQTRCQIITTRSGEQLFIFPFVYKKKGDHIYEEIPLTETHIDLLDLLKPH